MKPRNLMLLGGVLVITLLPLCLYRYDAALLFPLTAAGMLFGKGYGVWEERTRRDA